MIPNESPLLLKKFIVNGEREINYTLGVLNTLNALYMQGKTPSIILIALLRFLHVFQ